MHFSDLKAQLQGQVGCSSCNYRVYIHCILNLKVPQQKGKGVVPLLQDQGVKSLSHPQQEGAPNHTEPLCGVKNTGLRWEIHWRCGQQATLHVLAGLCEYTNSFRTAREIRILSYIWRNEGRKL